MCGPLARTVIYIGGFNFYYPAVRGTPYIWLEMKKVCQRLLRPEHRFVAVLTLYRHRFIGIAIGRVQAQHPMGAMFVGAK